MNILRDIQTAVKLTGEIRKARKAGADGVEVKVNPIRTLPAGKLGYWGFTPEDGEWADRVRFWQRELRPVLEPELYHAAMLILIQWCTRCVRRKREATA